MTTTILRPSPLDLGTTLGSAFRVFRQRLGQFVTIALVQGIAIGILLAGAIALVVAGFVVSIQQRAVASMVIIGFVALFVAVILAVLIQIKTQAMLVLGAHDEIVGQPSTFGQLFSRTSGVVGRVVLLVLVVIGALFALYGLFGLLFWVAIMGAVASDDPRASIGAMIGIYLLFVLVMIALSIAAVYFQVRFLYLLPALAVEDRAAVDGLKRSWALTKGNVLRTLGYYLVASLLLGAISSVVQMLPQALLGPTMQQAENSTTSSAIFFALLPVLSVVIILQIAVQLLAGPYLASYITVMFVDQIRRDALPAGFRPGFPPGPQPPAPQWQPQQPPHQPWGPGPV